MFSPINPVRYEAPAQFLCPADPTPATFLSDLTEAIADKLRDQFDDRPADVSVNSAAHQVVVSVREPIAPGRAETGTLMLSTTVRLYGLRWEETDGARRLRGQVAMLGEVYRLDGDNDFAWYVRDRGNRLGKLMDEVRITVTEVTDEHDA
jgi:hypothetical protein